MEMLSLKATGREGKVKPNALRRSGQIPGVVYGSMEGTMHVQIEAMALHKTFVKAGESTLVELDVDGKKVPVLFKDVSLDPVTDREIHADFYAVNMKEEIEAPVPIRIEGESPAVKAEGGILVIVHESIRVRCLPMDLPHNLTVDISTLAHFHDSILIKDINVPKGVKMTEEPDVVVVTVQEPRKEEVVVPTTPAEGEVAAGAEGAAPAEGAAAEGAAKTEAAAKEGGGEKKK